MSDRVYSLCEGHGDSRRVIRWGVSRLGREHDPEMESAVSTGHVLGRQSLYIEWTPAPIKQRGAAAMQAQRIRNGRLRVAKLAARFPLFAAQIERDEFSRPKYTLESCQSDADTSAAIDRSWIDRWHSEHPQDRRVYLSNTSMASES
jgi:hypothetical protein